jgi:hypothetical protein
MRAAFFSERYLGGRTFKLLVFYALSLLAIASKTSSSISLN